MRREKKNKTYIMTHRVDGERVKSRRDFMNEDLVIFYQCMIMMMITDDQQKESKIKTLTMCY